MTGANERETPDGIPSGVQLTALDPDFRENPHPVLAQLRERQPSHYDALIRRWILTRNEDIEAVLRDRSMGVDGRKAIPGTYMHLFAAAEGHEPSMLFQDPPQHTRTRALVSKAFTPRAVEALAPRIREIAVELLDAVEGQARWDLIAAYAGPLPVIVIAEMLGVDPADRADFKRWSDTGVMGFNPLITPEQRRQVEEAGMELDAYLRRAIADRRAHPRDDLMSALIAVEEDGQRLTDDEIRSMCGLLLAAGNVTTTDLIGNGVYTLLRHRGEWDRLRDDPSLMKNAVEELLRFEPPVVHTARIASHDAEIAGCPVKAGESVLTFLISANRDEAAHPNPDRFDITRKDVRHHAFGGGVHMCLGAPLARLEAQIALAELIARFPELRLAEQAWRWRALPAFRGLEQLWLHPR